MFYPDFIYAFIIAFFILAQQKLNKGRRAAQNKLIADIFFERTGLHRSRSQVASHLQQLRKWHMQEHGRPWEQDLPWDTVIPPSASSSPLSSLGALSSPSAPQGTFLSLSPSTSVAPLQLPALPPSQFGTVQVLPSLSRFDTWDPPTASRLDLSSSWSLQSSLTVSPGLTGFSPAQPPSASAFLPLDNSLLFHVPLPTHGSLL
ncbi:hypothetical protein AURDEDRAFT_157606 [Auricularia subglabra TFB-10046 SS5]|nr:hypothetical protein AURDEDRAFT_157606 [Auricularia subglabra TFB-10046 SS5]